MAGLTPLPDLILWHEETARRWEEARTASLSSACGRDLCPHDETALRQLIGGQEEMRRYHRDTASWLRALGRARGLDL